MGFRWGKGISGVIVKVWGNTVVLVMGGEEFRMEAVFVVGGGGV